MSLVFKELLKVKMDHVNLEKQMSMEENYEDDRF